MDIKNIDTEEGVARAARIAALRHRGLRERLPFLPERSESGYAGKIGWMGEHGVLLGLWREGKLSAFMGGFLIENFRNAGPGCFSPEWSNGAADPATAFDDYRLLYRAMAPEWLRLGGRLHALSLLSGQDAALEALSLLGFGRIVMDAAAPTRSILEKAGKDPGVEGFSVRRAGPADAEALAAMNAALADHIAASPVLMPGTRGDDAQEWRAWFSETDAVVFLAEDGKGPIGYIQAQEPQFDVSDSVHAPDCLAIDGMFCDPAIRGRGIGRALLGTLAAHALDSGKAIMSVDCETHNLEAYAFWTRFFEPVAWGQERRV